MKEAERDRLEKEKIREKYNQDQEKEMTFQPNISRSPSATRYG